MAINKNNNKTLIKLIFNQDDVLIVDSYVPRIRTKKSLEI